MVGSRKSIPQKSVEISVDPNTACVLFQEERNRVMRGVTVLYGMAGATIADSLIIHTLMVSILVLIS